MTTDPNTEWSHDQLEYGMESLRQDYATMLRHANAGYERYPRLKKEFKDKADALRHLIDFIEYNMREMDIVTPTETYLRMK